MNKSCRLQGRDFSTAIAQPLREEENLAQAVRQKRTRTPRASKA
jgi:hypothetical protein